MGFENFRKLGLNVQIITLEEAEDEDIFTTMGEVLPVSGDGDGAVHPSVYQVLIE